MIYQVENAQTEKLSETNIVCLTKKVNDIEASTEGTIVYVYNTDEYEVEFIINNRSVLCTVRADCLIKKN
jgi:hypothetical protein